MSKKNKFDLTHIVHNGLLKDGEKVYFVSDPKFYATVCKLPSGEYKISVGSETMTVHAAVQKCLGQEPPDHASKWFRAENGKTLYELWQLDNEIRDAA
ncbi:MAG: hypothetical protein HYW49_06445 [Deltaproteobacteria bacterium]|nr:hypothetical protein [Deltaproteobacteria bacterium]